MHRTLLKELIKERAQRDSNPRPTAPQAAQAAVVVGATTTRDDCWRQFHDWLVNQGKLPRTVKTNVQYAKRFWSVLETGDASTFATKLPGTRSREVALVALANYAKFTGKYERFLEIKKRYALRWNECNSTQFFERFFNEGLTLDVMLQRIIKMMEKLPLPMQRVIKLALLTGLRASEVIECARLCTSAERLIYYYNPDRQALEHFR